MNRRNRLVTATIVGGAAIGALIPLSPALSEESPPTVAIDVEIADTGTVVARGAGVTVVVQYTCRTDIAISSFLSVRVTQRSGSGIAEGFSSAQLTCTGEPNELALIVTPSSGRVFKKGLAVAQATANICGPTPCVQDTDIEEIQLLRA